MEHSWRNCSAMAAARAPVVLLGSEPVKRLVLRLVAIGPPKQQSAPVGNTQAHFSFSLTEKQQASARLWQTPPRMCLSVPQRVLRCHPSSDAVRGHACCGFLSVTARLLRLTKPARFCCCLACALWLTSLLSPGEPDASHEEFNGTNGGGEDGRKEGKKEGRARLLIHEELIRFTGSDGLNLSRMQTEPIKFVRGCFYFYFVSKCVLLPYEKITRRTD